MRLTALVEVDGREYPIEFTWKYFDAIGMVGGSGIGPSRASSANSVLKILTERHAVIFELPPAWPWANPSDFRPYTLILDPANLSEVRGHAKIKNGESVDGFLTLTHFSIESSSTPFPELAMSAREKKLRAEFDAIKYYSFCAEIYAKEQWDEETSYLAAQLRGLSMRTLLGLPSPWGKIEAGKLAGFNEFANKALQRPVPKYLALRWADGFWRVLPTDAVTYYRQAIDKEAPQGDVLDWIDYQGTRFYTKDNRLLFDAISSELVFIGNRSLTGFYMAEKTP